MARVIENDGEDDNGAFENGGLYPYDPKFTDLEMVETPFTVFEYLRQLDKGKVVVQPDFQRNQVWKPWQKSQFIESIILNFPLPPIYLNETKKSKYVVIDGLQRTTALGEFYKDKFKLSGLQAVPSYNGSKFSDLDDIIQSKFEDKKLTTYILKPSTPMVVIYDLFNRINTGGTQLNRQEVRNCIFIGPATETLRKLSERNEFRQAIDNGVSSTRMKDREVILRYLSFRWQDYKYLYTGDMSKFIENFMTEMNQMSNDQLDLLVEDFIRVMNVTFKIWGDKNFRIPSKNRRGNINTAILETVCNFISKSSDPFIENNINKIKSNYHKLLDNEIYYDAVTKATGNRNKVIDRFTICNEVLSLNCIQND